jgi:exodeoxyribonuclease III
MSIKISSWNINSIRNKIESLNTFLENENPDILFISETKIKPILENSLTEKINEHYVSIWNSNKTTHWHGTLILYKKESFKNVDSMSFKLDSVSSLYKYDKDTSRSKRINTTSEADIDEDTNKAHSTEGRVILCNFHLKNGDNFVLLGTYSPNSGVNRTDPLKRLAYRVLRWDLDIYNMLEKLKKEYKNVVWLGDLNVARKPNDMSYKMIIAGTTEEERNNFETFLTNGWIDTFDELNRELVKSKDRRTYGFDKKLQLRLDYVLCSFEMKKYLLSSKILEKYNEVSDHLPIYTEFNFNL